MFSFQLFSKPRLVSIGLLLAILVISLMFSSYAEGMDSGAPSLSTDNTVAVINKDAPASSASGSSAPTSSASGSSASGSSASGSSAPASSAPGSSAPGSSIKASNDSDAIVLGKLSVTDVTGILKNNAGVQKLIDQKLPSSK